ncbi:hypothetical protein NEOLI_001103, partial [Neolecta irregularis DAH-3]
CGVHNYAHKFLLPQTTSIHYKPIPHYGSHKLLLHSSSYMSCPFPSSCRMDLAVTPTIHMPIKWTLEGTLKQINKIYPYLNAPEAIEKFFESYTWVYYHMPQNSKWTFAAERLLTEAREMIEKDDPDFYSLLCSVTQDNTQHLPLSELIDISVLPVFVNEVIDLETVSIISDPISDRECTPTISLPFGVQVKEEPISPKFPEKDMHEPVPSAESTQINIKLEEKDTTQLNTTIVEPLKQPGPDQNGSSSPSIPEYSNCAMNDDSKAIGTNDLPHIADSPSRAVYYQPPSSTQAYPPTLYHQPQIYPYHQEEFDHNHQFATGHKYGQMGFMQMNFQEAAMYNPHYYHPSISSLNPNAPSHPYQYQGHLSKVNSPIPILKKAKSLPSVLMKTVEDNTLHGKKLCS